MPGSNILGSCIGNGECIRNDEGEFNIICTLPLDNSSLDVQSITLYANWSGSSSPESGSVNASVTKEFTRIPFTGQTEGGEATDFLLTDCGCCPVAVGLGTVAEFLQGVSFSELADGLFHCGDVTSGVELAASAYLYYDFCAGAYKLILQGGRLALFCHGCDALCNCGAVVLAIIEIPDINDIKGSTYTATATNTGTCTSGADSASATFTVAVTFS